MSVFICFLMFCLLYVICIFCSNKESYKYSTILKAIHYNSFCNFKVRFIYRQYRSLSLRYQSIVFCGIFAFKFILIQIHLSTLTENRRLFNQFECQLHSHQFLFHPLSSAPLNVT